MSPRTLEVATEYEIVARMLLNGELPVAPELTVVPEYEGDPDISEAEEPATTYAN